MNHFPQLTPIENKLKQIYQQSLERSLQEPCDREDVMDVLLASYTITNDNNITKSLTTHIDEQTFILENMDISFVRHARYTPAFWHRHDFFEIIFVQNGTCTNYVLGRSIPMRTGDICIMAPDVTHSLSAFHDEDYIINILITTTPWKTPAWAT